MGDRREAERSWYTTAEVAAQLGISQDSVRSAIRVGALESVQINPRLRMVHADAIDAYRRNHLGKRGRPPRQQNQPATTSDAAGEDQDKQTPQHSQ